MADRLEELKESYPEVLTTQEATDKYEFIGFMAPYVMVKDRVTGKKGTMQFDHRPRYYFGFVEGN